MYRRIHFSLPTLLSATLLTLAACSDAPTAARVAPVTLTPSAARLPGSDVAVLRLIVLDSKANNSVIPGATVAFTAKNARGPIKVTDNGAGDADPRVGYFEVKVIKSASYTAQVINVWEKYDDASPALKVTSNGDVVDMGIDSLRTNPMLRVYTLDARSGMPLAGATYTVSSTVSPFTPFNYVTDGAGNDYNLTAGVTEFYARASLGSNRVCEIAAPPLYSLPLTSCKSIPVAYNGAPIKVTFTNLHL